MCGRYTLAADPRSLSDHFGVEIPAPRPRFNIAPTQAVPIVRPAPAGREASLAKWGLIPSWAKDIKIGASCLNARSETVAEKPSFRAAFKRKRCLIPADGFYEWLQGPDGKRPIRFGLVGGGPFAFAGLWESWDRGEGPVESCAVITTPPNELVAPVHDRMPAILLPEDYDEWLEQSSDPRGLLELLRPFDAALMAATPASRRVNNARVEGPECLLADVA